MINSTPLQPSRFVHLVSGVDATDRWNEPAVTQSVDRLERACGSPVFTADVRLDRKLSSISGRFAQGAFAGAQLLGAAGAAVVGASLSLAGNPAGLALLAAGALRLATGRQLARNGLRSLLSALESARAAEPRWEGIRTYLLGRNLSPTIDSQPVTRTPHSSGPNPARLADFVTERLQVYPREHVSVVALSGNGAGYRAAAGMSGTQYAQVLEDVAGRIGRPIDLVIPDSALQANLEAQAGRESAARFSLVSEESFPCGAVFDLISRSESQRAGAPVTGRDLGLAMLEEAGPQFKSLALIDNQKIPALVDAVDRLGACLTGEAYPHHAALGDVVRGTLAFPRGYLDGGQAAKLGQGDLLHLVDRLEDAYGGRPIEVPFQVGPVRLRRSARYPELAASPGAPAVLAACREVRRKLQGAVVGLHTEPGYRKAGGLSIQLPTSELSATEAAFKRIEADSFWDSAAPDGWKSFVEVLSERL